MLKIRISGSENELKQIAEKVGNTPIQRFRRNNGKTSFAIDLQISVGDFIQNIDLGSSDMTAEGQNNCDTQEIQVELEGILAQLSDTLSDEQKPR